MKTVKQLIEELQKLNQDKPIWIYYDGYQALEPEVDISDGKDYTSELFEEKIEKGDYIMLT